MYVVSAGITGWKLPHMVIVKTKTIAKELLLCFSLPKNEWAHITSSSSAYINEELFKYWVDHIVVPGIAARHQALNLTENDKVLLLLDGCLSHSETLLKSLEEKGILYHFFVPHSSHLTQPLDHGTFSYMKQKQKSMTVKGIDNKLACQIMKGLTALDQACAPMLIEGAFWRAGLVCVYGENSKEVVLKIDMWLMQHTSPNSDVKEEFFIGEEEKKEIRKRVTTKAIGKTRKERNSEEKEVVKRK